MFPEKGKDGRWMRNRDGTEKSTQNCPGSFTGSWITPSRESEFQAAVPRDLLFQSSPTGLEHHPVWKLLRWGSCPCWPHGLDTQVASLVAKA